MMPAAMGVDVVAPKKGKKEKKAKKEPSEKRATKTDRRRVLKEMSSPDAFIGLLSGSEGKLYDEEEASKPIRFKTSEGKRNTYGSHHDDFKGSTSLGVRASNFTSYVVHVVEDTDTWANLSLKYSISMDDIRRFNKMYPTDTVVSRKEIFIPINDENRATVDPSIIKSGAAAAAEATRAKEAQDAPPAPTAAWGDAPVAEPEPEPVEPAKPASSAMDFLASFDSKFGKTKSSVLKKSDDIGRPEAAPVYGGRTNLQPLDRRIGNGIRGDTSHQSYQNRSR